jgi:hypothetical protein
MVISTKSAVRVVPAPPLPPAAVINASPQGPHCALAVAEFESVPGSVDHFTGTMRRLDCYQRFSLWAAGDRFVDMCRAKELGFPGWSFVGETGYESVAA